MGKGKGRRKNTRTGTMSLEEREKSLSRRERMLQESFSVSLALGNLYASSLLHKEMKEKMVEKDAKIRELESKLLEGRNVQHLGCDMEIQTLKSRIVDFQKELQGLVSVTMAIPIIRNEIELREEKKEKEIRN